MAIKEAVKLQRNDGLVMNQLFSRKAFLPYSRLVCNFRHFVVFSELDFKGLSDFKTWMDYFAHPARLCSPSSEGFLDLFMMNLISFRRL